MKNSDKNLYSIIKILGITEIVLLSYFIIFLIINLIDSGEISIVLINKLFDILYSITLQMAFPIIIFIVIIAIPYLLTFVMVLVRFIRKYVNFKGKKKKQIIKFILLLTLEYRLKFNNMCYKIHRKSFLFMVLVILYHKKDFLFI